MFVFFILIVLIRELREPQLGHFTEGPGYVYLGQLGRHPK